MDEGVAVEAFPRQGNEEGTWVRLPAVGEDVGDGLVQVTELPQQSAVHGLDDLADGDGLHIVPSPSVARSLGPGLRARPDGPPGRR